MKTTIALARLVALALTILLVGCDDEAPALDSSAAPTPVGALRATVEGRSAVDEVDRPLTDQDVENWLAIRNSVEIEPGAASDVAAMRRFQEDLRSACRARGLSTLEYQVIGARLQVASMHLDLVDRGVAIPDEKLADCDLVARHRDRLDAAGSRAARVE